MLQVIKGNQIQKNKNLPKEKDIYVTKYETRETHENGKTIIERIPKKVNVTKLVNETAKTIKRDSAQELVNKMTELLTKENEKK